MNNDYNARTNTDTQITNLLTTMRRLDGQPQLAESATAYLVEIFRDVLCAFRDENS